MCFQRRLFNEVLVDTPPESRKVSAPAGPQQPQSASGAIIPRREVSTMDAPAFLESLKSMPVRQQPQETFQRQRPVHANRGLLRPASSDSRPSSQTSSEQGIERSGSVSGVYCACILCFLVAYFQVFVGKHWCYIPPHVGDSIPLYLLNIVMATEVLTGWLVQSTYLV